MFSLFYLGLKHICFLAGNQQHTEVLRANLIVVSTLLELRVKKVHKNVDCSSTAEETAYQVANVSSAC